MSKLGCIIYCNKEARRWEVKPSDGCITFVMCWETGKAVALRQESEADLLLETLVFKPRPFVSNKLVAHDKLVSYPYQQLKEFVHAVAFKDEWGDGQFATENDFVRKMSAERAVPKKLPTVPQSSGDDGSKKSSRKPESSRKDEEKKHKPKSPRGEEPKSPRSHAHHHKEKKSMDPETHPDLYGPEPRNVNIDLSRPDSVPQGDASAHVPQGEGLELDVSILSFLNERYQPPFKVKLTAEVPMEQSEKNQLEFLDSDVVNLKKSVAAFAAPPKPSQKQSPFTESGLAQYFGLEGEEGELTIPAPVLSLQGLEGAGGADFMSPRDKDEPLIWTSGAVGLTKKSWYQLLGRIDDGNLSEDSLGFFKELGKLARQTINVDGDDRPAAAIAAVEAMDQVVALDPRVKKRLLEQASGATVGKRKLTRNQTSTPRK